MERLKQFERFKLLKLCTILIFLFLSSCAVNPVTGKHEFMLVSEEQELRIGQEAASSLIWEFGGRYRDAALESYLEEIVSQLWENAERPHLPMQFYIQNTSVPNAFALPGYVAITRGLLCEMENEAQFAAVMGHEVGHVMARHTAKRISRMTLQQMALTIGAAALEGKSERDTLLTIGAIGSTLLLLKYDRDQEIQSDRLGVKYMSKLGYDPREAITAHKILERAVNNYLDRLGKTPREDNFINTLLSTHPRQKVRISEIKAMIDELPPYKIKEDGRFSRRFQNAIKSIKEINKIYFIYDKAEKYYQERDYSKAEENLIKAIKLNDSQAPFYNLLGFVRLQQKKYKGARESFNKALSVDPNFQPSIYGMGLVNFFKENYSLAIQNFKKSLKLYPSHALSYLGLGKSYYHLRQYSEAIPYLKEFSRVAPRHPEIHGLLGICYEMTGNLDAAIVEYKYQLQVAPDTDLGRHARRRLAVLAPEIIQ
jgi:predicted Zn-dependent protease